MILQVNRKYSVKPISFIISILTYFSLYIILSRFQVDVYLIDYSMYTISVLLLLLLFKIKTLVTQILKLLLPIVKRIEFIDFFIADQLVSICSGLFIVAWIPYVIRILQCFRRVYDIKTQNRYYQLVNAMKYIIGLTAMIVIQYKVLDTPGLLTISIIAKTYALLWDIRMDWGISECKQINIKILLFIVINIVLRYISFFQISSIGLWYLEVLRRCCWNILRMRCEQLHQGDTFYAVTT